MHILYFTRCYNVHDQRYLSALGSTGHRVTLLNFENDASSHGALSLPEGINEVTWSGGQHPVNWYSAYSLLPELVKLVSSLKPNLIHAGPIQSSAFLSALAGFHPLVSMSWGYDLLVDANRSGVHRWVTRYTLRNSDVLIGDCSTIRQKALSHGMHPDRIITYPWGINLELFTPSAPRAPGGDTFTLLSTRAWEPIYGVDIIAAAFVKAARRIPQLRLLMLGGGSQQPVIEQIFSEGGVADRVSFPGQVDQAGLPAYYQKADLYIAASHSDGTSISLLEAMACGTPALVSDLPGNLEWITQGVNGWTFPDGDISGLAEGIASAWEKREQLHDMGAAARSTAERRADWTTNFPMLLEAYKLALQVSASTN